MRKTTEVSTVRVAVEVSFQVGKMDYGTILVPAGTPVFRHIIKSKDAAWKPETTKTSDWFVQNPSLLPDNGRILINGKHSSFFVQDATHYGITVPNANVCPVKGPYIIGFGGENAETFHKAHHY